MRRLTPTVVDLFCGAGRLSLGYRPAGFVATTLARGALTVEINLGPSASSSLIALASPGREKVSELARRILAGEGGY